jgi:hypothetical protein
MSNVIVSVLLTILSLLRITSPPFAVLPRKETKGGIAKMSGCDNNEDMRFYANPLWPGIKKSRNMS